MSKVRPTSPHITLYKFQINMFISILHRFSGVGLFVASIMFPWICLFCIFSGSDLDSLMECKVIQLLLFCLSFALIYHFYSGIRHIFYDMGYGFSIEATNLSCWIVIVSSIVTTIIIMDLLYLI